MYLSGLETERTISSYNILNNWQMNRLIFTVVTPLSWTCCFVTPIFNSAAASVYLYLYVNMDFTKCAMRIPFWV